VPTTSQHRNDETRTEPTQTATQRTVRIPGSNDHAGHHLITVTLLWICPRCGGPRGRVHPVISYDGSRRLSCDGWTNPCGHIDYYRTVRAEVPPTTETF